MYFSEKNIRILNIKKISKEGVRGESKKIVGLPNNNNNQLYTASLSRQQKCRHPPADHTQLNVNTHTNTRARWSTPHLRIPVIVVVVATTK